MARLQWRPVLNIMCLYFNLIQHQVLCQQPNDGFVCHASTDCQGHVISDWSNKGDCCASGSGGLSFSQSNACENCSSILQYIQLGENEVFLPNEYDVFSSPIFVPGGIPVLNQFHEVVTVSSDGYITLLPGGSDDRVSIVPYYIENDPSAGGSVSYEVFTGDSDQLSNVNSFISESENVVFNGTWLLVAQWDQVPVYLDKDTSNTYQAALVTDGSSTFTVYIYKCGELNSTGGVIGYYINNFEHHPLSMGNSSSDIACENQPQSAFNNVVYRLSALFGIGFEKEHYNVTEGGTVNVCVGFHYLLQELENNMVIQLFITPTITQQQQSASCDSDYQYFFNMNVSLNSTVQRFCIDVVAIEDGVLEEVESATLLLHSSNAAATVPTTTISIFDVLCQQPNDGFVCHASTDCQGHVISDWCNKGDCCASGSGGLSFSQSDTCENCFTYKAFTSLATDYYVAFPNNFASGNLRLKISFNESDPANVTVFSRSDVDGKVTTSLWRSAEVEVDIGQKLSSITERNKGIHIKSEKEVSVVALSEELSSADMFLVLPPVYLPDQYEYYAVSIGKDENETIHKSALLIVASEDNTSITMTLTQNISISEANDIIGSGIPGEPISVTLNEMDTLYVSSFEDLSGSRVVANKPISFISGHECGKLPAGKAFCDQMFEQIPPTSTWGKTFYTAPLKSRESYDVFMFVASADDTTITTVCNPPADFTTLEITSAGGVTSINVLTEQFCSFTSNKPVLLIQSAVATSVDNVSADPFMMIIPPCEQYRNQYLVSTFQPRPDIVERYFVNIVIKAGSDRGLLSFNGSFITDPWTEIFCEINAQNPCAYGVQIRINTSDAAYVLSHVTSFGITVYSFTTRVGQGYVAGLNQEPIALDRVYFNKTEFEAYESDGVLKVGLNLERSLGMSRDVTVTVVTRNLADPDAAEDGIDYISMETDVTFSSSEVSKSVLIQLAEDDAFPEANKTFQVYIRAPPGIYISPTAYATARILNDDEELQDILLYILLGENEVFLPNEDDVFSAPIFVPGGIPVLNQFHEVVTVTSNGHIILSFNSRAIREVFFPEPFSIIDAPSFIAPYWIDNDPSAGGYVSYEVFTGDSDQLSYVNSFISESKNVVFNGTWLLVAQWDQVPVYSYDDTSNTYQAALVTDGYSTFTVYTYECGELSSTGGVIGYYIDRNNFEEHPLSMDKRSSDIACENQPQSAFNNVVYRLSALSEIVFEKEHYNVTEGGTVNVCAGIKYFLENNMVIPFFVTPNITQQQQSASRDSDYHFNMNVSLNSTVQRFCIDVVAIEDGVLEEVESATLLLHSSYGMVTVPTTTISIFDNNGDVIVGFEKVSYQVNEVMQSVGVCAIVNSTQIDCPIGFPIEISLSTSNSSAVFGEDYATMSTIEVFDACEKRICYDLLIVDDNIPEREESFNITLERTQNLDSRIMLSPAEGVVHIVDDDPIVIGFTAIAYTTNETAGHATVCVAVLNPANGGTLLPFVVSLSPENGCEISTVQYMLECDRRLNFSIGDSLHCHNYSITNDDECELRENATQFSVRVSLFNNGIQIERSHSVAIVTIDDSAEPECFVVRVGYKEESYTLSEGEQSISICIATKTPGIQADFFINITTTNSTDFIQSATSLGFVVNSTHPSMTQCYNISFDAEDICNHFTSCSDSILQSQLSKANESDPVQLINDWSTVSIIVKLPEECDRCSTPSPSPTIADNSPTSSDGTIAIITILSFVGAAVVILIAVILVMILLYRHKIRKLENREMHSGSLDGSARSKIEQEYFSLENTRKSTLLQQLQQQLQTKKMIYSKDDLQLSNTVGQGESGLVYKAYLDTALGKELVAVKTVKALFSTNDMDRLVKEVSTMLLFQHTNVMSLIGVCIDGEMPLLVMQFMSNGSVLEYVKRNKESLLCDDTMQPEVASKTLLGICHQITKGMEYLSEQKFVHRDLAARNCMIDRNGEIKVADFGLTEDMYGTNYFRRRKSVTGSEEKVPIRWMAPESIKNDVYNEATDVWSFGVTMWEIYTCGRTPYAGIPAMSLLRALENGQRLEKPDNAACQDEIYEIMMQCWIWNDHKRPRFKALTGRFYHILERDSGYLMLSQSFEKCDVLTTFGPSTLPSIKENKADKEAMKAEADIESDVLPGPRVSADISTREC